MPTAKKLEGWALSEAKARISELVRLAQKEPQRIHVNGEASGAFISAMDLDLLLNLKKQKAAEAIKKFTKIAEEEGVYSEDFGELRAPIKDVDLK